MITIKADLTGITESGLLKAHLALLEIEPGDKGDLQPGDRLIVVDLFGDERFPATVTSIDGDAGTALLDVDWDADASKAAISGEARRPRYGMSFKGNSRADGNRFEPAKTGPPLVVV